MVGPVRGEEAFCAIVSNLLGADIQAVNSNAILKINIALVVIGETGLGLDGIRVIPPDHAAPEDDIRRTSPTGGNLEGVAGGPVFVALLK